MPNVSMNLYEVNKSIMAQKPPMKANEAKIALKEFISNIKNNYYGNYDNKDREQNG